MLNISLRFPRWFITHRKQTGICKGRYEWFSFHRWGRVNENRSWEIQLDHFGWDDIFKFRLGLDRVGFDHAGPEVELTILGFMFHFTMPSNQHWDYDTGNWESDKKVAELNAEWKQDELKEAYQLIEDEEFHQEELERARTLVAEHEARLAGSDKAA